MLKMYEIREIIKLMDQSSIAEMEIEEGGTKLSLKKQNQLVVATRPQEPAPLVTDSPRQQQTAAEVRETAKPQQVQPAPVPPERQEAPQANGTADPTLHQIVSPMVGTFYRAPEEGATPYVQPGDIVHRSTVVCIVEAMKLFNEIEAEVEGEIVQVLVENGQLVEYGQPLFLVKTA